MLLKYNRFILESKFLKGKNLIGYIEKAYYPNIESLLENFEQESFIQDKDCLIWDFENEKLTSFINNFTFKIETQNVFDLDYLKFTREPIEITDFKFGDFTKERVNHYMIKSNDSNDFIFGELDGSEEIKSFVKICYDKSNQMGLETDSRYCFITIDQKIVEGGESQRDFGWHIDGLQGSEVSDKKPSDYQFIWADETPTRFCTQTFDTNGVDVSTHNIFNWVGSQVKELYCYSLEKNKIYLMNPYHVHSATKAAETLYRRFMRVSFTNTPITSTKMIINPDIHYNYDIHITTGNIPKNLK